MSTPTIHSRYGASASHRWMRCPGSIRMSEGQPNESSEFAREGTMLHDVASALLDDVTCNADRYLDDEQRAVVLEYVQAVNAALRERPGSRLLNEHRFHLPYHPEFFGTADAVVISPPFLKVFDLKCGRGVAVEADYNGKINPQLGYYALGALTALKPGEEITDIEIVVVQPRLGGTKRRKTNMIELYDLAEELVAAAIKADRPDAPLLAGSHCKFCPGRRVCPELKASALRVAQMEFSDDPVDPYTMEPQELARALNQADIIETWVKVVRELAEETITSGGEVPGWGMVPKRAVRKWTDERIAKQRLLSEGLTNIIPETLVTPAQAERLVKKAGLLFDVSELVSSASSGLRLVRADGARIDAATEFENEEN